VFDILEELRLLNVDANGSDDKFKILCPYHEDNVPSCQINTKENSFKCFVCGSSGPAYNILARLRNELPAKTRTYIAQKYGVNLTDTIDFSKIERCHIAIWQEKQLLIELANRAVTHDLITKYRLGCENSRITIPITNAAGFYIDLRSYAPGAETNKFRSMKGYGGNNIFPYSQLSYDKIVIVGGEIKAIACSAILNQHGYGCVTGTTGEGNFPTTAIPLLKGKSVHVIMDVDEAGRKASKKLCHMLCNLVTKIYDVLLPIDITKLPKGGPDDFIALGGNLLRSIEDSEEWSPVESLVDNTPKLVSLPQAFSARESGKLIKYKGMIDCVEQSIYHIPKTLQIICDKEQDCCSLCTKIFPARETDNFGIHPESAFILETAGCSKASQAFAVRDALAIPKSCSAWVHNVIDRYSVENIRISSDLDIHNCNVEREMLPAFIVRDEDEQNILSNATYEFTGRTWPSPRNQEAISVISGYSLIESALESYKVEDPERLQVFQPVDNTIQGIQDKLDRIYDDLEANVTMIFGRRDMHLAIDLAYHSPLFFHFDKKMRNGWLSCLILGDSSNGKSEAIEFMMKHYRIGAMVEGGKATRAGIVGGLDKLNGTHFVTWGAMVQQDKRLLFIDELGENKDLRLLGDINDTRSSGFARLTMIQKAVARARTRLIMASNPVNKRDMSSYNYGVDAVIDLIGSPQYVRRFDLCVITDKGEVPEEIQTCRPEVNHVYTSGLCNELILWAWTIKDVKFENESLILAKSLELTRKYSEDIPLVDKGSMRLKLAKLSASLAARLYSTGEDTSILEVLDCHVDYVYNYLDALYSKPAFAYDAYSKAKENQNKLRDPDNLLRLIQETTFPRDLVEGLRQINTVDLSVITDIMGAVDRSESQSFLSALVRHKAVRRQGKNYYKSGEFTTYLKKWSNNGVLDKKPDYMKKKLDTL